MMLVPTLTADSEQKDDINRENGSFANSSKLPNEKIRLTVPPQQIELSQMTTSVLHEVTYREPPTSLYLPSLGTTIKFPSEPGPLHEIWQDIRIMEATLQENVFNSVSLGSTDQVNPDSMSIDLNEGLVSKLSETEPILKGIW